MHWTAILDDAAARPDGGPRSFPAATEGRFLRDFPYDPPNESYQKLFSRQLAVPSTSQRSQATHHSAGWLIPDDVSPCKPVLIAPSLLSAISLIRQILPPGTLPDHAWQSLVLAARRLASDPEEPGDVDSSDSLSSPNRVPPSAQRASAVASSSSKRMRSHSRTPTAKRPRSNPSPPFSSPPPSPGAPSPPAAQPPAQSPPPLTQPLEPGSPSQLPDSPVYITTVTNNNRRAERERERKQAARHQQNRLNLGLPPPSDKAARREISAYESIGRQDESDVAWILKQDAGNGEDLITAAASPYATATSMLEKARALGNPTAQRHAAAFLSAWRSRGSPFPVAGQTALSVDGANALPATQLVPWKPSRSASAVDNAFCSAYQLVEHYENRLAAVHIEYRWAMAFLGRAYADKVASLEDTNVRGNQRSSAIAALLQAVTPDGCKPTEAVRRAFKIRLNRAARWYHAAKTLDWGCLCLMSDDISPKWVEQTLRVGEWKLWLEVVKKVNPDAHKASQGLGLWLGAEGIAGGPIDGKKVLYIEADAPVLPTQAEEVVDSEDSEDDVEPAPARSLRQRSLVDMFKPRE